MKLALNIIPETGKEARLIERLIIDVRKTPETDLIVDDMLGDPHIPLPPQVSFLSKNWHELLWLITALGAKLIR